MSEVNTLKLRKLPSRDQIISDGVGEQPVLLKPKDQKYLDELELENFYLKEDVKRYKQNFDWSVLWVDDVPKSVNLWTIGMIVLQFLTILLVFLFKK